MDGFNKASEGLYSENFEAFNAMRKVYLGDMPDGSRVFWGFSGAGVQSGQIFLFDRDAYAEKCGNMKFMHRDDPLLSDDYQRIIADKLIHVIRDGELIYDPPGQGKPKSLANAWEAEGNKVRLELVDPRAVHPELAFVESEPDLTFVDPATQPPKFIV